MSGPDHETLTAALRRLADEHATGLLSVATAGDDVVIELAAGTPVTIGPVHDVQTRVGDGAGDDVVAAVVVDELVDRTVAAVVDGERDWTWDVTSSAERLPLPNGLVQELARRAVDAAQALGTASAETVLMPVDGVTATGELGRVRELFDGTRTVAEVADAAGLTVPAVATMATALLDGGALATSAATPQPHDGAGDVPSWSDTVALSGPDDDSDDEPEPWVMGPSEDDDEDDEDDEAAAADVAGPTPLRDVVAPTAEVEPTADVAPTAEVAPTADEQEQDEAQADAAPAASWNDTSWLDDLTPTPEEDEGPPVLSAGERGTDTRAALGSMLSELQQDPDEIASPAARAADEGDGDDDGAPATPPAEPLERQEPKAEPGDVAEFLRELSRLALDDD